MTCVLLRCILKLDACSVPGGHRSLGLVRIRLLGSLPLLCIDDYFLGFRTDLELVLFVLGASEDDFGL